MRSETTPILMKAILAGGLLALLQACSPAHTSSTSEVAQAYESSGMIPVPPYTRSIFNSSNF